MRTQHSPFCPFNRLVNASLRLCVASELRLHCAKLTHVHVPPLGSEYCEYVGSVCLCCMFLCNASQLLTTVT